MIMDFPDGPVVKTLHFQCKGRGRILDWGTKILPAMWHSQKIKPKILQLTSTHPK